MCVWRGEDFKQTATNGSTLRIINNLFIFATATVFARKYVYIFPISMQFSVYAAAYRNANDSVIFFFPSRLSCLVLSDVMYIIYIVRCTDGM